jgi:hypothetical protein
MIFPSNAKLKAGYDPYQSANLPRFHSRLHAARLSALSSPHDRVKTQLHKSTMCFPAATGSNFQIDKLVMIPINLKLTNLQGL